MYTMSSHNYESANKRGVFIMFKKILLASDGSEHALKAAEKAVYMTKLTPEAEIEVIYVADGATTKTDVLHNWNKLDISEDRKARIESTIQLLNDSDVKWDLKIVHGDPGPTIVEYANKHDFDLLIIGSRGLNAFQEMVLGSVSHKVVKRANCPVLVVKS